MNEKGKITKKKVTNVLILSLFAFQFLNATMIDKDTENRNATKDNTVNIIQENNTNEIICENKKLVTANIISEEIFTITQSKDSYLPSDTIEFSIGGNTTDITNYTLNWVFKDPTGEYLCNSTDTYIGTVKFNTTSYSDSFTSHFSKLNYYDLELYNTFQIIHNDNYSICDISLELPISHSLILGDYLFNITLNKNNETRVEERVFKVEDDIEISIEECYAVRGYNSTGYPFFEKEIWYPTDYLAKNYLSPGDNISIIVSLKYGKYWRDNK